MTEYGFLRVGAAVPNVRVADVDYNLNGIIEIVKDADHKECDVVVFPEMSVTGYTCADLFMQPLLMDAAAEAISELARETAEYQIMIAVGAPVIAHGRRYNCAIVMASGRILGIVPKSYIPDYGEFYEKRWFESGYGISADEIMFAGRMVPFGTDLLFEYKGAKVGVEICEDLWVPNPPSTRLCLGGADIILNLSASDELIGKHDYLCRLISQQSACCRCGYVYASAGWGESSTDLVFAGNAIIAEDGAVTQPEQRFFTAATILVKDIDVEKLRNDRARFSTYFDNAGVKSGLRLMTAMCQEVPKSPLPDMQVDPQPFVPHDERKLGEHCEEIVNIQARGLMQRLNAIHCHRAVIGISGGLDSTLALLVTVRAFDMLDLDRSGIIGITMPGMATTSRTHNNAVDLMHALGVTSMEIPIGKAVAQHFTDIGQDPTNYDVTFENSQARERTQILMDVANKENAIVIGTGDMSELALGWCTYNGDQMSMYGVNAGVPKTLVRYLVKWFAEELGAKSREILLDIVDTPISPELIPSGDDEISQKTEDLVGPYELHDFFLYHVLRNSFTPRKIYYLATVAFRSSYNSATILKWMRNFYRRFFNQQFKRSCMPDGPKVGSVCLSPRGDWRMPSDASSALWLSEIDRLEEDLKSSQNI
jgi:NAD+ synthase (glutamine-hydrolysing)